MPTPVKKIMTSHLVTIPTGSNLNDAHLLMKDKRIRHLPVVDENSNVLGVLSQRDINSEPESKNLLVDWMMTTPVYCVEEDMSIRAAIFKMLQLKISSLMVIAKDDTVVGIITTDDLLWHLAHLLGDDDKEKHPILNSLNVHTVGEVTNRLVDVGI